MGFCDLCDCTILQRTNWICSWFWVETTKEPRWNVYTMGFDMLASASKLLSPSLGYFLHTLSMCSWSSQSSSRNRDQWFPIRDSFQARTLEQKSGQTTLCRSRNHTSQHPKVYVKTRAAHMQDRSKQTALHTLLRFACQIHIHGKRANQKKTKQTHDIALSQNQNVRRTMAICRPELLGHKNESKNLRETNPPTCSRTQTYEVYRIFSNLQKHIKCVRNKFFA